MTNHMNGRIKTIADLEAAYPQLVEQIRTEERGKLHGEKPEGVRLMEEAAERYNAERAARERRW